MLFCALCNLFPLRQVPFAAPGKLRARLFGGDFSDYESGAPGLPGYLNGNSSADEELREILNAELPNGRLAMTAIKAMLFRNGTEGIIDPKYGNSGFPG